jgi:hypothetical protein
MCAPQEGYGQRSHRLPVGDELSLRRFGPAEIRSLFSFTVPLDAKSETVGPTVFPINGDAIPKLDEPTSPSTWILTNSQDSAAPQAKASAVPP